MNKKFLNILISITLGALALVSIHKGCAASRGAIVLNKIILPQKPDTYMEVRHIVLKGTNREIGKAIGSIAQSWVNAELSQYAGPIFAEAKREYMKKRYPALLERMEGVAKAYRLKPQDNVYVVDQLIYDVGPFACSSVYFPPDFTENGHALLSRNMDFYVSTMSEMIAQEPAKGEQKLFSRCFVMELYPENCYPSIVLGSLDLMNGWGGMNSEGIFAEALVDHNCPKVAIPAKLDASSGLNGMQLVRLVLDNCKNIDEAKIAILNNKWYFEQNGLHFQVGDSLGNSFICEFDENFMVHFTDNITKIQVLTNHPVYKYPAIKNFPEVSEKERYNSFTRYRILEDFIEKHGGKLAEGEAKEALGLVYGNTNDKSEGAALDLPLRLIWTTLYDLADKTIEVRFYLKDGKKSPATGANELILSKPFKFRLR